MLKLSISNIIKLLQVKGIGRGKIFKLDRLLPYDPNNDRDLSDFLSENLNNINVPFLSKTEILKAFGQGETLFEKSKEKGIKLIKFGDSLYPELLKSIGSPPIILNALGNIQEVSVRVGVAVIGTRQPSTFGQQLGERIGYKLGENHINVISGLAIGCDSAGHNGCLKAGGMTTAVLAHGLDMIYPKENTYLAESILDNNGCLLSEYLIKTRSIPNFFIERDRIQAGLATATFVIETDVKGGTMHAVNATLNNKRILVVYNHPKDKQTDKSRGNQMLINQDKAIGIQTKEDIETFIRTLIPINPEQRNENGNFTVDHEVLEFNAFEKPLDVGNIVTKIKNDGTSESLETLPTSNSDSFELTPPPPKKIKKKRNRKKVNPM